MNPIPWWQAVTPHADVRDGRIDESLFAASLEGAVRGTAPDEYSKADIFFRKTYLTQGLRTLLTKLLRHVAGIAATNPVATLQTSFGGGKTHTELAIYHLLEHPDESLRVDQVRELVEAAGMSRPPECRVVVLSGVDINPLGRKTDEGLHIRTLWGEMAYQLGGAPAYAMVAANDEKLVSPGVADLTKLLEAYGPAVILLDETLHYVDKVSRLVGVSGNLADNTVAFLREMTDAVRSAPRNMMVVSLTASSMEQLSSDAMGWLDHLNQQVAREDTKHTPVERTEVHEIVRRRLFESVDEKAAAHASQAYRDLYVRHARTASLGIGRRIPAPARTELPLSPGACGYPLHPLGRQGEVPTHARHAALSGLRAGCPVEEPKQRYAGLDSSDGCTAIRGESARHDARGFRRPGMGVRAGHRYRRHLEGPALQSTIAGPGISYAGLASPG